MIVFDPRDQQWKESDNPALMLAQHMMTMYALPTSEVDWTKVVTDADFCDQPVDATGRPVES